MVNFDLYCDGCLIRNLDDLRENFNVDEIYEYYSSGVLVAWLRMRNYEREYILIEKIKPNDSQDVIISKICSALGVKLTQNKFEGVNASNACNTIGLENKEAIAKLEQRVSLLEKTIGDLLYKINVLETNQNNNALVNSKKSVNVGDIITFGKYYSYNDIDLTDLEWLVLDIDEDKTLLITKECIDAKAYTDSWETFKFGQYKLEKWLNDEFMKIAFSGEELRKIIRVKYNKIWIPTADEIEKYGCENTSPTKFAKNIRREELSIGSIFLEKCMWWTSTSDPSDNYRKAIVIDGKIRIKYGEKYDNCLYVRPMMWVKL
ncbi:MAG: DUF6273 domain-containing protein [Phascolarctobacterium sp.]|nr:DUF6273 domain-containing protein [Phascolarctobacterium sp.]